MSKSMSIETRNLESSSTLETYIYAKAKQINDTFDRHFFFHVMVEQMIPPQAPARMHVCIEVDLPGGEVSVDLGTDQNVYQGLQEAFSISQNRIQTFLTHSSFSSG